MVATERFVTGLSMLLAPLLLLVGFAIHPPEPQSGADLLAVISNSPDRWNIAHILFSASMVLSLPSTLGLMRLLGHRGRGSALLAVLW